MARRLELAHHTRDIATLIDVGVSKGTPELYAAFPDAYLVLVEPLVEHERHLRKIVRARKGEYLLAAAGSRDSSAVINVEPTRRGMSSLLKRAGARTGDSVEHREIPVIALDGLLKRNHLCPPFGIKIDTEGFELEVIRGARQLLKLTDFVIAETSVCPRFNGGYRAQELIRELRDAGFVAVDFLKSTRAHVDVLFAR